MNVMMEEECGLTGSRGTAYHQAELDSFLDILLLSGLQFYSSSQHTVFSAGQIVAASGVFDHRMTRTALRPVDMFAVRNWLEMGQ